MTRSILIPLVSIIFSTKTIAYACLTAVLSFFAPIQLMFLTFTIAVLMDMITGMMASKKRKEKIVSRKMRRTITKLFTYASVASLFYLFQMAIMPMIPIINIIFGLIILVELKSITENCDVIFKTKLWTTIYEKVNNIFKGYQKGIIEGDKKDEQDEESSDYTNYPEQKDL